MEDWLVILAFLLPPSVLAAVPPRTAHWRRARTRFWIASAAGALVATVSVSIVNRFGPAFWLGPAVIPFGTLFVAVVVFAVWCAAAQTIRNEWSEWRKLPQKVGTLANDAPAPDPTKPWKK